MVEDIVGCKWSLRVMDLVRSGVQRPGAMQKSTAGLTTKVLNERLRMLMRYGILDKKVYSEVPPRVEYRLTRFGENFQDLLDDIERLQARMDARR